MQITIKEIVNRFKDQNCVLLFGPGLAKNEKGESLQSCLSKYFEESELEIKEDLDDLYTCDPRTRTLACDHLKEYCRDHGKPNDSHRELALIPCHLYVSITPDLLMKRALDDCGVDYEFNYYLKDQVPEEVAKPTAEKPLLYNLFGSIENQKSLIFTHGDLIQYLFSIIKEFKLPQNLRDAFENANYFIFLGFDFEKWYLKLLLRLILNEKKLSIATEEGTGPNEKLKIFYQANYGLEFVDNNIEEYVKNLFDECGNQGLLRKIGEKGQPSIQKEVKKLIKQDELKQALERLLEFLKDQHVVEDRHELINELYIHSRILERTEKDLRNRTIREEEAIVEKNRICKAILEILQQFENNSV